MARLRPSPWLAVPAILLLAGWWLGRRESPPPAPAAAAAERIGRVLARRPLPTWQLPPGTVADASYATALTMFREWSAYPPNSRPIDDSHEDVASPFAITAAEVPLGGGSRPVSCRLQPLRHTVVPGEVQLVVLQCRRGSERDGLPESRPALALVIEAVEVQPGVAFVDDGSAGDAAAGDRVYTLAVPIPATAPPGLRALTARARIASPEAGDPAGAQTFAATFAVAPRAPAGFTGRFHDRVEDGSLIVEAELDVGEPGRYRLLANLEAGGALIAYAKEDRDLVPGRQVVPFLFFGKILRDAMVAGPLRVTNVRGHRFGPTDEPLAPLARAHETQPYAAAAFSPREWQSDYKRERLAELEALARSEAE